MSDQPNPRSYSAIVGEMVDALLARLGLPALKVGSPALSIIEAAAQSDFRSSQDIFGLLNSMSLDRATGQALKRIGDDEGVIQIGRTAASGTLTFGDSSFTKISSSVYQGFAAPIIGSTTIRVQDASLFPATGSIYIGRNTANYEGPLAYTAKTNLGSYWTLTLSTGTTKFHNLGETVVVAQGGNRTIPVNTVVSTAQGNAGTAVQFSTTFAATIPDGETEIASVPASALEAGVIGNAVVGSVVSLVSAPFAGATVTNPAPFTNGYDTEDDQSYRERIRQARQSRTRGTALAIQSGVVGLTALDENKRILSASVVTKAGEPAALYIDDGTGYEEKTEGIAFEVLVESAVGGEQYFQLANGRPVTKAFVQSSLSAPFNLSDLSRLAVEVGGVLTTHVFRPAEFRSIGNAAAYEVAAAINADPTLLWTARTSASGTKVVLTAKADSDEQIQVVAPSAGEVDANAALGFTSLLADTLWLYKDDIRLNKDGRIAAIVTKPNSLWSAISAGATLNISVDGIAVAVTFNDVDFVNAGTPYVVVSQANDLASWAKVFNLKIPGVTTTVSGSSLVLTSNRGRSAAASLSITGGTTSAAFFSDVYAVGEDQDYLLDRNLGQIKLNVALLPGERLTAGSFSTRSFVESATMTSLTIAAEATTVTGESGAEFWVTVDGNSTLVPTLVGPGTSLQVTLNASPSWGKRVRIESGLTANIFEGVRAGDWVILTDSGLTIDNRGAYRIVRVPTVAPYSWLEVEQPTAWAATQAAFSAVNGGLKVVRTSAVPQRVALLVAGNPYTPATMATAIQSQLHGAAASTYRTDRVRIRTNTFINGDLAVVAANVGGTALGFPIATPELSGISHLASATAQQSQRGTPSFTTYALSSVTSTTVVDYGSGTAPSSGSVIEALKSKPESTANTGPRWGNDNFFTTITSRTGTALTLRDAVAKQWLPEQRFMAMSPYAISARDQLGIVLDGDEITKRYTMNMYRKVKPTTNTYGAANFMTDTENSGASLAQAFGIAFNWTDFAVHMKARAKANGILWRYFRHGSEGNFARVGYSYPSAANAAVGATVNSTAATLTNISVGLASGAARAITSLRNTSYIGRATTALDAPNLLSTYTYFFHLPVASGAREIRIGYASGAGARTGVVTGGTSGATATTVSDSGTYVVVTGVAGSFFVGEALTFGGGGTATSTTTQYGHTTMTLTTPGAIDHGLVVGDPVWLQSTDVNFTTGTKVLTAASGTSISYNDTATTTAAIAGVLTISKDLGGEVSLSGSSAVSGDIISDTPQTTVGKTLTLANDKVTFQVPTVGATSTAISWTPVNPTALTMYPLNAAANSTSAIIASVGALNTAIAGFESTAGTISWATYEAPANGLGNNNSGVGPWYPLKDGLNFVQVTNAPVLTTDNFEFTFKDAVEATLVAGADWINEDVRLVPITSANVVRFLNSAAVGGLFSGAEIASGLQAAAPQITTISGGSAGSVLAVGGSANATTAAVIGNASVAGTTTMVATVSTAEAEGLTGGAWVSLDNAIVAPKSVIAGSTALAAINGTGLVHVSGSKLWKYSQDVVNALTTGQNWHIEKQGPFVAYVYNGAATLNGFSSVREGDWVAIDPRSADSTYAANGTANTFNRGLFRVVRTETSTSTFWIENPNAVEENATVDVAFLDYDSILPADTLVINTALWGVENIGSWTVARINFGNQNQCYLDISTKAPVGATAGALGSSSPLVQVYESVPGRLIKQIQSVAPNGTAMDIRFSTSAGSTKVNAGYGTVVTVLDKLEFPTVSAVPGTDGYTHSTGLIEEANRVVYGDESQSSTYPGIAAAGAAINISGPLVRRITASLAIRTQSGASLLDVRDQVRSAVAATINETKVGASIAISDLVSAAQSVNGVVAVTILSPTYGSGSDLIAVQPYEKPLVYDIEQDIQISFVGD